MALLQAGLAFIGGYAVKAHCIDIGCSAKCITSEDRNFKLTVVVRSAVIADASGGPGLIENMRPVVGVSTPDKTKETELGDWSKEDGVWRFQEVITLTVSASDEISVYLSCSTRYNLYVAAVSLTSRRVGEVAIPVSQLIPGLRAEDRDAEGLVHATPVMAFDVTEDGRVGKVTGRVHLSFETKTPLPVLLAGNRESCCGWNVCAQRRQSMEEDIAVAEAIAPVGLPIVKQHAILSEERRDPWLEMRVA